MQNMQNIIFLDPVFKEAVWGGNRLCSEFGYPIPSDRTGEAWVISAHEKGDCRVSGGELDGKTLSELWAERRELFGNIEGDRFPLLTKILDAAADLSIQVHPDDSYAALHENGALGKTECWYVLDCTPGATIVIGHHARDRAELEAMIREKRWSEFIREVPLKRGDFFQIEPGCLHAIKGGTLILETQQNSDITYRVYDYDRLSDGRLRPLHIEESIAVLTAPFELSSTCPTARTVQRGDDKVTELVRCGYYGVEKHEINGAATLEQPYPFLCASVIEGSGTIDGRPIKKGEHFILPSGYPGASVTGALTLITSHI